MWKLTLLICGVVGWFVIVYGSGMVTRMTEPYEDPSQVEPHITNKELFAFIESIPKHNPTQADASTLIPALYKYKHGPQGSTMRAAALRELYNEMSSRRRQDKIMHLIVNHLFGSKISLAELLTPVALPGQPYVNVFECQKSLMIVYKRNCGPLSYYGGKYTLAMANMCKAKINGEQMDLASSQVCGGSGLVSS